MIKLLAKNEVIERAKLEGSIVTATSESSDTPGSTEDKELTEENFTHMTLNHNDRQAGVSLVFDPETSSYVYNAYLLEKKLLKELKSQEFEFLSDALAYVNDEFAGWELITFDKKGCGSCAAKK
ncbi:MAG: hypothetical protein KBD78_12895 [Oligoflexales bacterium]|nr:hypothetical protein [Oligoflexales bacterium]